MELQHFDVMRKFSNLGNLDLRSYTSFKTKFQGKKNDTIKRLKVYTKWSEIDVFIKIIIHLKTHVFEATLNNRFTKHSVGN